LIVTESIVANAAQPQATAENAEEGQIVQLASSPDAREALDRALDELNELSSLPAQPPGDELSEPEGTMPEPATPDPAEPAEADDEDDDAAEPAKPPVDDPAAKRKRASDERRNKAKRAAKPNRKRNAAKAGRSNVVELYGIVWHPSVERALAAAQGVVSDERDKPVFCLRVLGDLAGFM
jgi:hypothetical protein